MQTPDNEETMAGEQHVDTPEVASARAEALKANAEKFKAEAEKAKAETKIAKAEARQAEITLEREEEKRNKEKVADYHRRVYRFETGVDGAQAKACMATLSEWSKLDPGCDIEIVFSSPGGSVLHGMALFDFIRGLQSKGHQITTRALGYAASMAGILMQVGDHRIMSRESWLLIHQGTAATSGSMGEIEDTVGWFKRIDDRILDIFFERSHMADPEKPLARATIKKKYERKDWWLSSDECLKHGFCDEIA